MNKVKTLSAIIGLGLATSFGMAHASTTPYTILIKQQGDKAFAKTTTVTARDLVTEKSIYVDNLKKDHKFRTIGYKDVDFTLKGVRRDAKGASEQFSCAFKVNAKGLEKGYLQEECDPSDINVFPYVMQVGNTNTGNQTIIKVTDHD